MMWEQDPDTRWRGGNDARIDVSGNGLIDAKTGFIHDVLLG
jgi:hypothetical protein